jgi:DNA polymerase III sliding clamp (beta) subunit (PCNA family)
MIRIETLKAIVNSFNVTSEDATRYHIMNVLVKAASNDVIIVATDGHKLSELKLNDKDFASLIDVDNYLVTPDQLKVIKLILKEYKNLESIPVTKQDKELSINPPGLGINVILKTDKSLNIEFPDYQKILPKYEGDDVSVIAFNPEYLLELFKALKDANTKCSGVKLTFKGKTGAILVQVGDNKGVLMPMRL